MKKSENALVHFIYLPEQVLELKLDDFYKSGAEVSKHRSKSEKLFQFINEIIYINRHGSVIGTSKFNEDLNNRI